MEYREFKEHMHKRAVVGTVLGVVAGAKSGQAIGRRYGVNSSAPVYTTPRYDTAQKAAPGSSIWHRTGVGLSNAWNAIKNVGNEFDQQMGRGIQRGASRFVGNGANFADFMLTPVVDAPANAKNWIGNKMQSWGQQLAGPRQDNNLNSNGTQIAQKPASPSNQVAPTAQNKGWTRSQLKPWGGDA